MSIFRTFMERLGLRPDGMEAWELPFYREEGWWVKCPSCGIRVDARLVGRDDYSDWCDVVGDPPPRFLVCPYCYRCSVVGTPKLQPPEPTRLEDVVVPVQVYERIERGYRDEMIKAAWFIACCFDPYLLYNEDGAKRTISNALSCLNQTGGFRDPMHTNRILLRFGLLLDIGGSHRYRMTTGRDGSLVPQTVARKGSDCSDEVIDKVIVALKAIKRSHRKG